MSLLTTDFQHVARRLDGPAVLEQDGHHAFERAHGRQQFLGAAEGQNDFDGCGAWLSYQSSRNSAARSSSSLASGGSSAARPSKAKSAGVTT